MNCKESDKDSDCFALFYALLVIVNVRTCFSLCLALEIFGKCVNGCCCLGGRVEVGEVPPRHSCSPEGSGEDVPECDGASMCHYSTVPAQPESRYCLNVYAL